MIMRTNPYIKRITGILSTATCLHIYYEKKNKTQLYDIVHGILKITRC